MPACDFVITRSTAATLWSDPALPPSLLGRIAADPAALVAEAARRPVKIDHETLVVRQQWPVGDRVLAAAVKQYRPRGLWKAVAGIFRPAKAMRNWRKAEFLLARGIATPRPLLACRPRRWTARSGSFLATQWIEGGENLHLYGWRLADRPLAARLRAAARCAEALGRLLGQLHSVAIHRDLKAANFLVVDEEAVVSVYLVDLDGLETGRPRRFRRQARDLARLAAGLDAHAWVTRTVCLRFLRAYLGNAVLDRGDWKDLWRAIAAETSAYIRRKRERNEKVL